MTHAKKHIPDLFFISVATWGVRIFEEWDGKITSIYWLFGVIVTTAVLYIGYDCYRLHTETFVEFIETT